jgi:hypothetical protein
MARTKVKDVAGAMWLKRLERCNPLDKNDIDIQVAHTELMPKSNMIYVNFRNKPIGDMDEMSLQNWANGDAGKNKFPKVEIQCLMVYVVKYGISEWKKEGMSDLEIVDTLRDLGFLRATLI